MIDREIAPIWHDRFARLIVRNLPGSSDVIALDIHCGVGRTTAELLARLGPAARVLAIEPDDTLIEMAKTRMRPEWRNRVYLKPGNFDDVAGMADDSYNLVVANLVLGDTGDIGTALAEMIRVNRIGGRTLATLPLGDSWPEVEDIFAEVLRDAGLTAAVRRLERLRELRPTGPQLAQIVRGLGVAEDDFVIEQERFQILFPSGREFLFAPVVEHGPLDRVLEARLNLPDARRAGRPVLGAVARAVEDSTSPTARHSSRSCLHAEIRPAVSLACSDASPIASCVH